MVALIIFTIVIVISSRNGHQGFCGHSLGVVLLPRGAGTFGGDDGPRSPEMPGHLTAFQLHFVSVPHAHVIDGVCRVTHR